MMFQGVPTSLKACEATVFVVDDDPLVREYLHTVAASIGLVAETYENGQDFLAAYDPTRPGCLLADVRMPGVSGLELQRALTARGVPIPTIIMTGYGEVSLAVEAMKGGAVDFLEKPFSSVQVLIDGIQKALAVDRELRERRNEDAAIAARLARLTSRQRQVLDGMVAGKPSKAIGAELGISPKTVDVHRSRIMRVMQADSLPDLLRRVLRLREDPAATTWFGSGMTATRSLSH